MNSTTSLSIIVIARNEAQNIARSIESILRATENRPGTEILLVDSVSSDETLEIAKRYPINIVRMKSSWFLSASAGRYIGTIHTKGDLILFLDGDMELDAEWLNHAIPYAQEHPEAAIITGFRRDVFTNNGLIVSEVDCRRDRQGRIVEGKFTGGAMLCKRLALLNVCGFQPFLKSEEEIDLSMRLRYAGYKVIILPYLICRHFCIPMGSWAGIVRRMKLDLWLGYGQVPRYHLGTPLFWTYLSEQGQFTAHILGVFITLMTLLFTLYLRNIAYFAGWLFILLMVILVFSVKKRSLRKALLSFLIHILIIYSSIRGFFMAPRSQKEYPTDVEIIKTYSNDIYLAISNHYE